MFFSFVSYVCWPTNPSTQPSVEVEQQSESVVQREIIASRASNADAGDAETQSRGASNDPHVVLNDDDIVADPGLRIPTEQMHPNIMDAAKKAYILKLDKLIGGDEPTRH